MGVNKVVFGAVAIMDISDSTVTPDKLAKGATAYDKSGEKITGTMEAATDPKLQEKSVTPRISAQIVTPDSGYDGLSKVNVGAMPATTQTTPSISVSSSGLITASATQTAGYVAAGTKSATKQLTTQAAKTITPTTSNQTAVASGRYTTGAITVKGDANLVAGNIKKGVSIFGVSGSYEGSGGGGGSVETCTLTIYHNANSYFSVWTTRYDSELGFYSDEVMIATSDSVVNIDSVVCGSAIVICNTDVEEWSIGGYYGLNVISGVQGFMRVFAIEEDIASITLTARDGMEPEPI